MDAIFMSDLSNIITALISVVVLAAIFGGLLGLASRVLKVESDPIVEKIDALLPQTQCGQCGYPGCRPYAEAVANGDDINKCTPGGQATVEKIAELMGVEATTAETKEFIAKVAFIDEANCIGCTKCIQACPVDAIAGSNRALHTVLKAECTSCELCVAPCPTNCIHMLTIPTTPQTWKWELNKIPVMQISTDHQGTEQK